MASGAGRGSIEVEDLEPVPTEQADPLAVRQLERDVVTVFNTVQPEVVADEPIAGPLGIRRPADVDDRRAGG